MVFDRPNQSNRPRPATSRPNPPAQGGKPKKVITVGTGRGDAGGGQGNRGGGSGGQGGGNGNEPSPWLGHPLDPNPNPIPEASFVEYLRWMRSLPADPAERERRKTQDANTKVQILQIAEERANYRDRLTTLTNRTKLIAGEGNTFQVKCLWRIRVGGHRGPESILLPAFDALGMPYIPASTLRGVARTQAIREHLPPDLDYKDKRALKEAWKDADRQVAKWFGHLDEGESDRVGKVIFLDAYPLPQQSNNERGGLAVDMANNIWKWEGDSLAYSPNPNPFLSLNKAKFLVGVCSTNKGNDKILAKVKYWLCRGLQAGIGSQVNTGYGSLVRAEQKLLNDVLFSVDFALEGQLIHGRQKFKKIKTPYTYDRTGKLKPDTEPEPEIRPVAFKATLRYWFRVFALGFLPLPQIRHLEASLFGSIDPEFRARGWLKFQVSNHDFFKETNDDPAQQQGSLTIYPSEGLPSEEYRDTLKQMLKSLTWLAFHLGGVGQGARRPCYSRNGKPRWRGSSFLYDDRDSFWQLPPSLEKSKKVFQGHLSDFHDSLGELLRFEKLSSKIISMNDLRSAGDVEPHNWVDAADRNCVILIVGKASTSRKSFSLHLLHQQFHALEDAKNFRDAKSLCGGAKTDKVLIRGQQVERKAKPSPVLISEFGDYQIVTVFGATQNPRKHYLDELKRQARGNYVQIFPFT